MSGQARVIRECATALTATSALLALYGGCGDRDGQAVRSYSVPKEAVPAPAQVPAPVVVTGVMQWDLPDGWTSIANPNPMRFATITAGGPEDLIEVSITRLGGAAGGIPANINLWRQQVGLPPAGDAELAGSADPVRARGAQGMMVDLVGPTPAVGGAPPRRMLAAIFPTDAHTWFIKTIATEPVLAGHREAFVALCESVRFAAADGGEPAAAAAAPPPMIPPRLGPTWKELPAGWTPAATPVAMSVASFTVSDGDETATLTITPLTAAQDLLANVNRWRRQLGVRPLADLADEPPEPIMVGGEPGSLVDIAGGDQRTLAAVSLRGRTAWFLKLTGPDALVDRQRPAFVEFVRSIEIEANPHE